LVLAVNGYSPLVECHKQTPLPKVGHTFLALIIILLRLFLPLFGSSLHLKQAVCVGFKKLPATENKKSQKD